MADVAIVFHWDPSVMDKMTVSELMDWRERARARIEPEK